MQPPTPCTLPGCLPTTFQRDSLESLLVGTGLSALNAGTLALNLLRVLSTQVEQPHVPLSKVFRVLELIHNHQNRKSSIIAIKDFVARNPRKGTYNELGLASAISELYQVVVSLKDPGLGFLLYRLRPHLKRGRVQAPQSVSPNGKSEELFEESKERETRKR